MQEKKKGGGNNHLVIVLIALLALIVVVVFYLDRQQQRRVEISRTKMQAELLGDFGPGSQQQVQAALQGQGQTVGLGKQVSYKNIIALVAPSVVSVNVDTGFLGQAAGRGLHKPGMSGAGRRDRHVMRYAPIARRKFSAKEVCLPVFLIVRNAVPI